MRWKAILCAWMLAGPVSQRALAQQAEQQQYVNVSFPGKPWMVEINSPGFAVQSEGRKPDGREYLLANNSQSGVVLSVTLERSQGAADPGTCRDYLEKRMQSLSELAPEGVQYSEVAQLHVVEYLLASVRGVPLKQKNFVACTTKEDVFVDIHLSKVNFQPADESLFTEVLNRVHFADHHVATAPAAETQGLLRTSRDSAAPSSNPNASSTDYFSEGSRRFLARDYHGAIGPYQAALDLEKKQQHLSKNYWRVLVDNLGMAYGITGDLDRAEETFNYGASKDPNYPMFQYNLACVAGERNDMQTAMQLLQKAFALKANGIPGEGMPDPRQDDSFQRFMTNPQFRKFADTLMSSN